MGKAIAIWHTTTCRCNCYTFPHPFWDYVYGCWWKCCNCGGWMEKVPSVSGQKA